MPVARDILIVGVATLVVGGPLAAHHAHPPHAPATIHVNASTLVSSGSTGAAFRAQYATPIETLVDDTSAQLYYDRIRPGQAGR
jgi:hypothetical protein